jgi:hypothetical protein
MLAHRLTTILPEMTLADAMEATHIHCVAGRTGDRTALVATRPFRAPHHPISDVRLIGGGQVPQPPSTWLRSLHLPSASRQPKLNAPPGFIPMERFASNQEFSRPGGHGFRFSLDHLTPVRYCAGEIE